MRAQQVAGLARLGWEVRPLGAALPRVELEEAHRQAQWAAARQARSIPRETARLGQEIPP